MQSRIFSHGTSLSARVERNICDPRGKKYICENVVPPLTAKTLSKGEKKASSASREAAKHGEIIQSVSIASA